MSLTKIGKLGSGTYGKVYKGKNDNGDIFAVKINLCEDQFDSQCAIKELDINASIEHSCIMPLLTVCNGNPFCNSVLTSPLDPSYEIGLRHDTLHFVFPIAECDLHTYTYSKKMSIEEIQMFTMHILLGLEYLHASGIIHRDLKLNNILIVIEGDLILAKIADFGLSKHYVKYQHHTPDVITYNHRPVECTTKDKYDYKADVWSLGCMMYEMIMRKPLIIVQNTARDVNYNVTREIMRKVPSYIPMDKIKKEFMFISPIAPEHSSMKSLLGGNNNEDLVHLVSKILEVDQNLRYTTTECLNHRFFDNLRTNIESTREAYKPIKIENIISVVDCEQRNEISLTMYNIYVKRLSYKWYSHKILFHSMMMMDRLLSEKLVGDATGHILGVYCYAVCYMFFKYFSGIRTKSFPFSTVLESNSRYILKNSDISDAMEFENMIVNSLRYRIYQPTMYDLLCNDHEPIENEIEYLVRFCVNIHKIMKSPFTVEEAYKKWNIMYRSR